VTGSVRQGLEESAFIRTLRRFEGQLVIRELPLDRAVPLADAAGQALGLTVRAFPTKGKLPVHFVGQRPESIEDSVGISFLDGDRPRIAYAAATASADGLPLDGHDVVFFDGTFYREDELVRQGLSRSYARDMAHLPIDGPEGSLARLAGLRARKIYTHINNTNPILSESSEERRRVEAAGWEVAHDEMEIVL